MNRGCDSPPFDTPRARRMAIALSLGAFLIAASMLAMLERQAWEREISPHLALVRCVSTPAVVLGTHVDEDSNGFHYPRVRYRYEIDERVMECSVVRDPHFTRTNGEEGDVGEVRFYGEEGKRKASEYAGRYVAGKVVTAYVNPVDSEHAMLVRQELDAGPFLWGLTPGAFVPFVWMFVALFLGVLCGRPRPRWVVCGWALLTLAGCTPVFVAYSGALDPGGADTFMRCQRLGLALVAVVFIAALSPFPVRGGMSVGLILLLACGIIGVVTGIAITRLAYAFGWRAEPNLGAETLLSGLEVASVAGVLLGLLIGIGAWRGWCRLKPM